MEVAAVLRASNVSVIDQAVPPVKPMRPRKALSLLLSAVLGLTGGVVLAVTTSVAELLTVLKSFRATREKTAPLSLQSRTPVV
jgi:capsular polysaccharide biosynthesis protein